MLSLSLARSLACLPPATKAGKLLLPSWNIKIGTRRAGGGRAAQLAEDHVAQRAPNEPDVTIIRFDFVRPLANIKYSPLGCNGPKPTCCCWCCLLLLLVSCCCC